MLDLERDPAPGEPSTARGLSRAWGAFADEVEAAERGVRSLAAEGAVLEWIGAAGTAFRGAIGAFPDDLAKCKESYRLGADALGVWASELEECQDRADRALAQGRTARADLVSAQAALASAIGVAGAADQDVSRLQAFPTSSLGSSSASSSGPAPDPVAVRRAVRSAQAARARVEAAQVAVGNAQSRLDAARRIALDAQAVREDRGRVAARAIDAASDAGIANRSFWDSVKDVAAKVWDATVTIAKVVVVVLGVVALIVGGPIAWIVLAAGAVLLADALYKHSQGEATWGDVAWAALGVIPGTRGLTTISALRNAARTGTALTRVTAAGAHLLSAGRAALTGMSTAVRGAATTGAAIARGLPGALADVRVVVHQTPEGLRVPAGLNVDSLRMLMSRGEGGRGVGRAVERANADGLVYRPSPKHDQHRPGVGRQPMNGAGTLKNSIEVNADTTTRRVGVDRDNDEFVVFDQTHTGEYHGHVRTWSELNPRMRAELIKAGLVNPRGKMLS